MTTLLHRADPVDLLAPERRRAPLAVAVVVGAALGVVDLLLQLALPYPWAMLANSSAMWALVAFGYGVWAAAPGVRTAVGGAVLLVTAVVVYYLAAALLHGDDIAAAWSPNGLAWAAAGVVAGVVFASAGALRTRRGWWAATAAALAGGVCFAEFAVQLVKADGQTGAFHTDLVVTAVLTAVIGAAVLLATARTVPATGRALLLSVPVGAVGFAGFAAAGFVGAS